MRTISYGIPILVVGVLAALPFRRVPEEPLRDPQVQPQPPTSPTALIEIDSHLNAVWTPPAEAFTPPPAAPPELPPLPTDYEHVAVPLTTPPAIAERYQAVQGSHASPPAAWAHQPPADSPPAPPVVSVPAPRPKAVDLQASTGWETDLPLERVAEPSPPSTADRREPQPTVAALQASFPKPAVDDRPAPAAAPPRKRYFIREPVGR